MRVIYRVSGSEYDVEIESSPAWFKLDLSDGRDRRRAAVRCADDFHYNHDGWESSWPIELEILGGPAGSVLGRFEIEREVVPEFTASEIEEG